jgi:hypothetical protein
LPVAHLDLTVARLFGSNKTSDSPSPLNPSTPSPLSFSLRRVRGSEGHHREGNRAGDTVLSSSLVCAPTVGWTRRRRAASWWHLIPRAHHPSGGRGLLRDLLHRALTHKWGNGEILISTTCRRAVVQVLPARRTGQRPMVVKEVK